MMSKEDLFLMRCAIGMTQTELAYALGTTQARVSTWECGRAKPSKMYLKAIVALCQKIHDLDGTDGL